MERLVVKSSGGDRIIFAIDRDGDLEIEHSGWNMPTFYVSADGVNQLRDWLNSAVPDRVTACVNACQGIPTEVLQQPEFNRAITFLITQFGQTVAVAVEVALADEQARLRGLGGRELG